MSAVDRNGQLLGQLYHGTRFVHARLLDEHRQPTVVCTVTAFRHGYVFYRVEGSVKARDCFDYGECARVIARIL